MSGNQDQIDYWNGPAGKRWAEAQESMDRNLSSINDSLFRFAGIKGGERVLDIGCGCGTTTLAFAEAAGPAGRVTGLDISAPMLGVARARAKSAAKPVEFLEADASVHSFKGDFDAVTSRFGVMFFSDPTKAFANIRRALKPGGRLAFVCWRAMPENAWAFAPFAAAREFLPQQPPPDPYAPGPFAFADSARLKSILEGAGFTNVKVEKLDTVMHMAASAKEAAQFSLGIGPLARAAAELDEATRARLSSAWRRRWPNLKHLPASRLRRPVGWSARRRESVRRPFAQHDGAVSGLRRYNDRRRDAVQLPPDIHANARNDVQHAMKTPRHRQPSVRRRLRRSAHCPG
ncbi:MAG: class I SAM-dependent methyltransferase [Rhizomicrobium sp.]